MGIFTQETVQQPQAQAAQPTRTVSSAFLAKADYKKCYMNASEKLLIFIGCFVAGTAVAYLFYMNILISAVLGAVLAIALQKQFRTNWVKKRKKLLRTQFKEFLAAMVIAMGSGANDAKAVASAYNDLLLIYSEKTDIMCEIRHILDSYNSGIRLTDLYMDFAIRSDLEDIRNFASIYDSITGKSSGTDEIMANTASIIAEKMTIENEIETMVTAAKSEQSIMLVLPIILVAFMNFSGSGFMSVLHETTLGMAISTLSIAIFATSYFLSVKFTDISA